MPWAPELFSAPVLARLEDKWWRETHSLVPFFPGLMTGETDALIGSFAGEPELHHPVRGRVKGARALVQYVSETNAWLHERNVSIEDVDHVMTDRRGVEEVVLHLDDGERGRVDLPVAVVGERRPNGGLAELRVYYSSLPLTGRHAHRPPVLQPEPGVVESDVVGQYQRALAAGDLDAIVAAFEGDGYVRESAGGDHVHRGPALREFYGWLLSNDGGISLEHCAVTDDTRACALEYNLVRWGRTELPPEAGIAVHVRGESGKLAAVRIYDDSDPPLRDVSARS